MLIQYLLATVFCCVVVKIFVVITEYLIWRWKLSYQLPGVDVTFLNFVGNFNCLPFTERSRNGFSIFVHIQKSLLGFDKLLNQEKLYRFWLFIFPVVILSKAEAIEAVFSSTKTIEKAWFYKWTQTFFGTGLFTSGGSLWRQRRRCLNAIFHKDVLAEHLPVLNYRSQILSERLKEEIHKDSTRISKPISECTSNIIYEIVYGHYGAEKVEESPELINSMKWGMRLVAERMFNCFHWLDFIYYHTKKGRELKKHVKTVKDFTRLIIQHSKQNYQQRYLSGKGEKSRSLLELLLEQHLQGNGFTEDDVCDELLTFIAAGQDSTSAAISWILYMLGLYPDVQSKVHKELDLIFGEDSEKYVTQDDLNKMHYLKCVIKETLRLYPPVPILARHIDVDLNICGYLIPRGTTCVVLPHVLHRNEEMFPNAEIFDPDRFLPERSRGSKPYSYFPFSAGPRNCIGQKLAMMEQLVIVSTLLRSYKLESLEQRDKILPALKITTTSSKPIRIRIRRRPSKNI